MAGIPQNFAAISNVLPTYNFTDLAAGTGIITFYAGNTIDLNLLSNNTFYSDTVSKSASVSTSGAYAKDLDLDFDCLLNRPLVIQGKVVVNVPILVTNSLADVYGYVVVRLRKWDGVTETEIADNTSSVAFVNGGSKYLMTGTDLNIPLTTFKKGEYLRLTVEGWAKYVGLQDSATIKIGCDPMNRSADWDGSGAVPSRLVLQLPVRLNL